MQHVERWESRTEVPLLLLATAFLVAYAWPVLNPTLDHDVAQVLEIASWTIWAAFAIDLIVRIAMVDQRGLYVMKHWYDVVLITVPMLRPLRLLRLLAFARILNRSAVGNLAGRVGIYVAGAAAAAIGIGALAVLDAERADPNANIVSFGDALWWAATTVTTVGYGDRYPGHDVGPLHCGWAHDGGYRGRRLAHCNHRGVAGRECSKDRKPGRDMSKPRSSNYRIIRVGLTIAVGGSLLGLPAATRTSGPASCSAGTFSWSVGSSPQWLPQRLASVWDGAARRARDPMGTTPPVTRAAPTP